MISQKGKTQAYMHFREANAQAAVSKLLFFPLFWSFVQYFDLCQAKDCAQSQEPRL